MLAQADIGSRNMIIHPLLHCHQQARARVAAVIQLPSSCPAPMPGTPRVCCCISSFTSELSHLETSQCCSAEGLGAAQPVSVSTKSLRACLAPYQHTHTCQHTQDVCCTMPSNSLGVLACQLTACCACGGLCSPKLDVWRSKVVWHRPLAESPDSAPSNTPPPPSQPSLPSVKSHTSPRRRRHARCGCGACDWGTH